MQRKTRDRVSHAAPVRQLRRLKMRILLPLLSVVLLYYFAMPVLITWFPGLMNQPVTGELSLAWLFALSQFFMCAVITLVYIWRARSMDELASIIRRMHEMEMREYSDTKGDGA